MLVAYYVICIIYCFYQLNVKYKTRGVEYSSPELDAIMVLVMAWILAPIDVSLTWIRMVKDAEEARIRQSKFELDTSDFRNEETHIYQQNNGGVAKWLTAPDLKSDILERVSWVRILPPPQTKFDYDATIEPNDSYLKSK